MENILIAVDDTKGTQIMFKKAVQLCKHLNPAQIILLYVEKFEGRSLMDEMLGEAEMSALKEDLKDTDFKKALDKKALDILQYYKNIMLQNGLTPSTIRTVIRTGHPAEEIIKGAEDEGADMIIIGTRGNRINRLFIGSVSREVVNSTTIPVLLVR